MEGAKRTVYCKIKPLRTAEDEEPDKVTCFLQQKKEREVRRNASQVLGEENAIKPWEDVILTL